MHTGLEIELVAALNTMEHKQARLPLLLLFVFSASPSYGAPATQEREQLPENAGEVVSESAPQLNFKEAGAQRSQAQPKL